MELAVKALKSGAADFVLKPWDNDALIEKILAACQVSGQKTNKRQGGKPDVRKSEPSMVIGHSPAMMKLVKVVAKVAKTDANILITGENGTGKEMLAREIHRLSLRSRREIASVDMGAVSESLFESELFGHERGAFTDARESRAGKFEAADGSSLFLDEIGNLPLPLQAKLLAALQNREITRLGSNKKIPVDIHLIAATNRDLPDMVAQGTFREDLYYRINTIHIEIPPLRKRKEDIPLFTEFFLQKYADLYKRPGLTIHPQAVEKQKSYPWPGNIRELGHTIEKAVILAEKNVIRTVDYSSGRASLPPSPRPRTWATWNAKPSRRPSARTTEACQSGGQTRIEVKDNGPGIPKELLEDIFVPFFTTKASGSGTGLSLSRQIIRMHGGELSAISAPFQETCFRVVL